MRVELEPAYILHTRNYRDSSLIVEFLTPNYGRITAVVKGVRASSKSAKQRRSLMQPFMPLIIGWGGKGELKTLYGFESKTKPIALVGHTLFSGLYVNELIARLIDHHDESHDLFGLYEQTLNALLGSQHIDVVLRFFELKLLELLGYGLNLETEALSGDAVEPNCSYRFIANKGFVLVVSSATGADIYRGCELKALASRDFDEGLRKVAKRLCRQALGFYLGDKPLKSRELFKTLA